MANTDSLPDGLKDRLNEVINALNEQNFYVLVWGSGKKNTKNYKKRMQIKKHLEKVLGKNQVYLSEDKKFRDLVTAYGLGGAEELEVRGFDAIVVLDTSIGPHCEITKYEEILRGKGIVFVTKNLLKSGGFASVPYCTLKVEGYSDSEFEDCKRIRKEANSFVQGIRFAKARPKLAKLNS